MSVQIATSWSGFDAHEFGGDAGARVAFGSDWSVSTANPMDQIETAITRISINDPSMRPFIPEERIDLATAIDAFTINAAFVNKHEEQTGSIEVGKLADLIVLDRNLFDIAEDSIAESRVLLTVMNGQVVHRAEVPTAQPN